MDRGDAETPRDDQITGEIIGAAIEVHRELGPGLLESTYEQCLCHELSLRGMKFDRQVPLPVEYKGIRLDCGYRMDVVVAGFIVVELKTVDQLLPIHEVQLLTYLKLSGHEVGLLLNFNVPVLKDGVKRMVNNYRPTSAPPRLGGVPNEPRRRRDAETQRSEVKTGVSDIGKEKKGEAEIK